MECVSAGESKVNGRGRGGKDEVRDGMRRKKRKKEKKWGDTAEEGGVM